MITAASFPTPHLALRTNDPAAQARVGSFADLQAAAAEDVRRRLVDADLPTRPFHEVLGELQTLWNALTRWRYELALAAPGRLGHAAATEMPADEALWSDDAYNQARGDVL